MSESEAPTETQHSALNDPVRVFINYRRVDMAGWAIVFHDRLASAFGAENVFLDVRNLVPGMRWLEEIKSHDARCNFFLALIGPMWKSSMAERRPDEDYVRIEIEYALQRKSGVDVIPVVVGSAVPPTKDGLPTSLQPLVALQVARVREERVDEDLGDLIARIEEIARSKVPRDVVLTEEVRVENVEIPSTNTSMAAPSDAHLDVVLRHMTAEGSVVTVLGSRLNRGSRDADWHEGCGIPPDADDLAATLANYAGITAPPEHLAEVAQYVWETQGKADLYRPLGRLLGRGCEPGPVHRFLAELRHHLQEAGLQPRHQLIVTTNYDDTLELAFQAAREPYDLALYMASGEDEGRFTHFLYNEVSPRQITSPNSYAGFPIDDYGELGRTIIVKIHGAVDGGVGDFRWRDNYVITEDHYIDYLSHSPAESLVPIQILDKLRNSHCLFLGYAMRDWSLRVFMKRIWGGKPLGSKSWAAEPHVDVLEKEFWTHANVDVYAATPAAYLSAIGARLRALRPTPAET